MPARRPTAIPNHIISMARLEMGVYKVKGTVKTLPVMYTLADLDHYSLIKLSYRGFSRKMKRS